MNKRMSNKKCSFRWFILVECLANTLHFTKHDSHLYDCSWTNCSLIHVNKKDSHHHENYEFIRADNFIELRFLTNDCRMCDCLNILQSSIIWIHFDVTREFIFESIFFLSKSLTMTEIELVKSLKTNHLWWSTSFQSFWISLVELNLHAATQSSQLVFLWSNEVNWTHLSFIDNIDVYIYRKISSRQKKKNLHHISSTRFDETDLHMSNYKKRRTSIIFMLYI